MSDTTIRCACAHPADSHTDLGCEEYSMTGGCRCERSRTYVYRHWPDGRVRLPEPLAVWVDGHCEPGMDDDPDDVERHRNVVTVALWSLIYRQGHEPDDQAALDEIARHARRPPARKGAR